METMFKLPIRSIAPLANKVVIPEKKNVAVFVNQRKSDILKVQKKKVEKTKDEVANEKIEKRIEECRARRAEWLEKKKQLVRDLRNNRAHVMNKSMREENIKKAMQGPKETHQIEKIVEVIHESKEVLKVEKFEKVAHENKEVPKVEKFEKVVHENNEVPKVEKFEKVVHGNKEVPKVEKFEKVVHENKEVPKVEKFEKAVHENKEVSKFEKFEKMVQERKEIPKIEKSPDFINLGFEDAFSDNYAQFEFITKGDIATVYKARSTKDDEAPFVAVKIFNKSKISDEIALNIKMEVDLLAALNDHPDTVDFYGAYEDEILIYVVIELLEQGDQYHELLI